MASIPTWRVLRSSVVSPANGAGVVSKVLDMTGPGGTGIVSGVTRNFQCWYRDPSGGPSDFNLSDGLSVTFTP